MVEISDILWNEATRAMQEGRPADAMCHLAEIVSTHPSDRHARLSLALALGHAGDPATALKIMRLLADRLAHEGQLLAAIVVARHGLDRAPDDPALLELLRRIHIRGARVKAASVPVPPPLRAKGAGAAGVSAASLLQMAVGARLGFVAEVGGNLPPAGPPAPPVPLPLFCELDTDVFIEVVKRLRYNRVGRGTVLLKEGEPGDTMFVLASGQATVVKGDTPVAQLGPGAVVGEMGLITRAPRSATVVANDTIEYLELARAEVVALAKVQPKVADELGAYCRSRLLQNLLRTSPLFSRFDEPTRVSLLSRFKTTTFEAGETVVVQGQPASGLYLIASGEVDVRIANPDGETVKVAELGPGQVFGEISLLRNQPANAYVTARTTVGGLVLSTEEFYRLLQEHPGVHEYLEGLTAERIKASRDALDAEVIDPDDLIVL